MTPCGCNRRQEGDVLTVSALSAVIIDVTPRSNAQGRIGVAEMREQSVVVGVGTTPVTIVGEDEVPPSRVFGEVADDLVVATLLSPIFTARDAV